MKQFLVYFEPHKDKLEVCEYRVCSRLTNPFPDKKIVFQRKIHVLDANRIHRQLIAKVYAVRCDNLLWFLMLPKSSCHWGLTKSCGFFVPLDGGWMSFRSTHKTCFMVHLKAIATCCGREHRKNIDRRCNKICCHSSSICAVFVFVLKCRKTILDVAHITKKLIDSRGIIESLSPINDRSLPKTHFLFVY